MLTDRDMHVRIVGVSMDSGGPIQRFRSDSFLKISHRLSGDLPQRFSTFFFILPKPLKVVRPQRNYEMHKVLILGPVRRHSRLEREVRLLDIYEVGSLIEQCSASERFARRIDL